MTKQTKDQISTSVHLEIPFYDVDSYRIVWHGNYPKYFEIARCALLEKIGYSYQRMEETRCFFPVIDLQVRYIKAIKFKQNINIQATLESWQNKLLINYLIRDSDNNEKLTKGSTTQVAVLMPEQITQYETPKELVQKVHSLRTELQKCD
jgi:acyl-CoA thioester hydrolase